jgi:hypothetical protein
VLALVAAATWLGSALAQQKEKIPDFSLDKSVASWIARGCPDYEGARRMDTRMEAG